LDSVVNQTLREIEIICVNDGSTDKSPQILEEYAQKDKRIKIINKENEGPAIARNIGMGVAKGEYLSFVDADDFISNSTSYENLYKYALKNNAEIVSANLKIFFNDNYDEKYKSPFIAEIYFSSPMLPHDYGNPWYYQKNLFKRHFLLDHDIIFPNYIMGEDPVLLVKALTRVERIYGLPIDFYNYRVSSYHKINTEEKEISYIKHFKEVFEILKLNEFESMILQYESRMYDFFIKQKFDFGSKTLEKNIKSIFGENSDVWTIYKREKEKKMNNVKVSVIIPVYNVEKYLRQCLDSVVNQTLREIEIICVNDGSTDKSPQILEEYAQKDNRIKIINKKNAGLGAARNTGMEYVSGEYIGFLDSDDWADHSMYEKLYENAKMHKSDMVMCPINLHSDTNDEIKHNPAYFSLECFDNSFDNCVFDYKKTKRFIFNIAVTAFNKIYKAKFLRNIDAKFPEGVIFEDNPFFYQTYLHANKVSLIRDSLIFYRVNRADSIISSADQRWFDVFEIEAKNMKFFAALPDYYDYKMDLIRGKIFRVITRYFELDDVYKQKFLGLMKKDFENMSLTKDEVNNLKWVKKSYLNVLNSHYYNEFERLEEKDNSVGFSFESKLKSNELVLNNSNPKISIILPAFNVEDYIKEALESILKQTIGLENLEVIMINDCSTDQTGKIIDEYSNKYKNFKAIHLSENSGNAGKPRNVGIENSTGEYLMFLDPDDFYSEDMCETLYNKIVESKIDLVFCNFNQYFPNKKVEKSYLPSFGDSDEIILKTIDENPKFLDMFRLWTIILKRDFIFEKNIKFNEHILAEDRLFLLEIFLESSGIVYLQNYFGTNYRVRSHLEKDSLSNATNKKALMDRVKGYEKAYDVLMRYKKEDFFAVCTKC
jgi:Glycosyltransferases involved in cell wall biogenesis